MFTALSLTFSSILSYSTSTATYAINSLRRTAFPKRGIPVSIGNGGETQGHYLGGACAKPWVPVSVPKPNEPITTRLGKRQYPNEPITTRLGKRQWENLRISLGKYFENQVFTQITHSVFGKPVLKMVFYHICVFKTARKIIGNNGRDGGYRIQCGKNLVDEFRSSDVSVFLFGKFVLLQSFVVIPRTWLGNVIFFFKF